MGQVYALLAVIPLCPRKLKYIPRDLLDDIPNKRSALAEMALGSADSWLDDTNLGFLDVDEISPVNVHRL